MRVSRTIGSKKWTRKHIKILKDMAAKMMIENGCVDFYAIAEATDHPPSSCETKAHTENLPVCKRTPHKVGFIQEKRNPNRNNLFHKPNWRVDYTLGQPVRVP